MEPTGAFLPLRSHWILTIEIVFLQPNDKWTNKDPSKPFQRMGSPLDPSYKMVEGPCQCLFSIQYLNRLYSLIESLTLSTPLCLN